MALITIFLSRGMHEDYDILTFKYLYKNGILVYDKCILCHDLFTEETVYSQNVKYGL